MNRRRKLLIALGASALAMPVVVLAQVSAKLPRIGYVLVSPWTDQLSPERAAFLQGLRELGYVEGKNIAIEYRSADWDLEQLPRVVGELAALKVDVIFAASAEAAMAAKQAVKTIPVVFGASSDPVGLGLAASLARPGGIFTGLSLQSPELAPKRLELLKEIIPHVKRIAVLRNSQSVGAAPEWNAAQKSARALGMALVSMEAGKADDFVKAFAAMSKHRPDALMGAADVRMTAYRKIIAEFAEKNRLPTVFSFAAFPDAGCLMSYGPSVPDLFRRAASYVDKILKGAKPGDIPIEQPTKFELVINMKTAKALGIKIPQTILVRADRVIE